MMKQLTVILAILAVAAFASSASAVVNLQDNLVSVWHFNETAGATVAVDSISGNNATFTDGMTTTGSGFESIGGMTGMGNYLNFNGTLGSASAAIIGNPASLDMTNQVTVAMWVRMDLDPLSQTEQYVGFYDSQADDYVLWSEWSGRVRSKLTSTTALRYGTDTTMVTPLVGNWSHFAITYDATGDYALARMYINGAEVSSATDSLASMNNLTTGQIASFGGVFKPADSTIYGCLDGGIDEAGVWSRALTADEIAYLYNSGAGVEITAADPEFSGVQTDPFGGVSTATPVVQYKFEDNLTNAGSGSTTYDGTNDGAGTYLAYSDVNAVADQGKYLQLTNGDITTGGDRVVIPVEASSLESGTMSFCLREDSAYNYNSIFNCPQDAGDWEMWIYGDAAVTNKYAGRINSGGFSTNPALNENGLGGIGTWNHYTVRWVQEENGIECNAQLFLNGVLVDTYIGTWAESGLQLFLGGGSGNDYATWSMDNFRLYDVCLNEDAILGIYEEDMSAGVEPPLPGDANLDGYVDGSDATILAGYWQQTNATWAMGDFNGDTVVDGSDATILAGYWQQGTPPTAAAVPEPSTVLLILSALAGLGLFLRRR